MQNKKCSLVMNSFSSRAAIASSMFELDILMRCFVYVSLFSATTRPEKMNMLPANRVGCMLLCGNPPPTELVVKVCVCEFCVMLDTVFPEEIPPVPEVSISSPDPFARTTFVALFKLVVVASVVPLCVWGGTSLDVRV